MWYHKFDIYKSSYFLLSSFADEKKLYYLYFDALSKAWELLGFFSLEKCHIIKPNLYQTQNFFYKNLEKKLIDYKMSCSN